MLLMQKKLEAVGPLLLIVDRPVPPEEGKKTDDGSLADIAVRVWIESLCNDDVGQFGNELCKTNVSESCEGQTFANLIAAVEVGLHCVEHPLEECEVRLLVEHDADGNVARALLRELLRINQIQRFFVAKLNLISKNMGVNELPHILLLVVSRESLVLELLSNLCHLFMDNLDLLILGLAASDVANENGQAANSLRLLIITHAHRLKFEKINILTNVWQTE